MREALCVDDPYTPCSEQRPEVAAAASSVKRSGFFFFIVIVMNTTTTTTTTGGYIIFVLQIIHTSCVLNVRIICGYTLERYCVFVRQRRVRDDVPPVVLRDRTDTKRGEGINVIDFVTVRNRMYRRRKEGG